MQDNAKFPSTMRLVNCCDKQRYDLKGVFGAAQGGILLFASPAAARALGSCVWSTDTNRTLLLRRWS